MKVISHRAEDTPSSPSPGSRELADLQDFCLRKQQEPDRLASLHMGKI